MIIDCRPEYNRKKTNHPMSSNNPSLPLSTANEAGTRLIVRYRATATLRRRQLKQYTASYEDDGILNQRVYHNFPRHSPHRTTESNTLQDTPYQR